jgi:hypothetical protein
LETGVGSAGAVLETDAPEAGRRRRSQTAVRRGARRISPMPNVW